MKKSLLGTTALIGGAALAGAVALAAEAPQWKLGGSANFQFYWVDQDQPAVGGVAGATTLGGLITTDSTWVVIGSTWITTTSTTLSNWGKYTPTGTMTTFTAFNTTRTGEVGLRGFGAGGGRQDHGWYFGVDEAELQLNVTGTADNGLNYGFKIEINADTTDNTVADEVRLQFSGGWGTLQMGDEDGAEDVMNYGGENLMGATGGFDGDQDDYMAVCEADCAGDFSVFAWNTASGTTRDYSGNILAPSYPTIAGDTSDKTKVSYFSPRFSGFQVGASITPTPSDGDNFKQDGDWENHIGLGANYDNSFGDLRIRASAVYSGASSNDTAVEDIAAWSVGGIVGWGPFSLGGNYTDNGDSGQPVGSDWESAYWNAAAGFETGPMYFSAGYMSSLTEGLEFGESTYDHIALTADYNMAPGLGFYAEVNLIDIELGTTLQADVENPEILKNSATSVVLGMAVKF